MEATTMAAYKPAIADKVQASALSATPAAAHPVIARSAARPCSICPARQTAAPRSRRARRGPSSPVGPGAGPACKVAGL